MLLRMCSNVINRANAAIEQLDLMVKDGKGSLMISEGTFDTGIQWAISRYNRMPFMKPRQK